MIVRPETPSDYAAIAEVTARAFGRGSEALIISLHRHRPAFDPGLSLVAEMGGQVVGHALFSPRTIALMGEAVPSVNLGPIAVHPDYQGQGVGGALIEEGHHVAAARGNAISFLIGHRTYYPRFGYRTNAYGSVLVSVPVPPHPEATLQETPVEIEDVEALQALWRVAEGAVDFAVQPGPSLLEWVSPDPSVRSVVFRRQGDVVGYARYPEGDAQPVRMFLSRDPATARAMVGAIARHTGTSTLRLPIHPRSAGASAFGPSAVEPMAAAMAAELIPGALAPYFEAVERGERPLGRVIWPVEFDLNPPRARAQSVADHR